MNASKRSMNSIRKIVNLSVIDILLLISLVIIAVVYWYPIRFLPYFSDTTTLLINGTKSLQARNFYPPVLSEFQLNHPTLFYLLLGIVWQLFGETAAVSHAFMIPWIVLLGWSFYKLIKHLSQQTDTAIVGTFGLLFLTLVVNQFQLISIHLGLASMLVLSLYLWMTDSFLPSLIAVAVGILISWTAILILPALLFDWWRQQRQKPVSLQLFLIPLGSIVFWLLYHNTVTGWFFLAPNQQLILPESFGMFIAYVWFVTQTLIFTNLHWLYIGIGLLLSPLLLLWKKDSGSPLTRRAIQITWIITITSLLYFGLKGNFGIDSSLFLLPILWGQTILSLQIFISDILGIDTREVLIGILLIISILSLTRWRTNPNQGPGFHLMFDHSLNYQDTLNLHRQAAAYLTINHTQDQIIGAFPEISMLTETHQGYVDKPLEFKMCENFIPNPEKTQVLYLHAYHQSQLSCHQLLQDQNAIPLKQFRLNGKWIELFTLNVASKSASPQT